MSYFRLESMRSRGFLALLDQGQISLLNFVSVLLLARWFDEAGFGAFVLAYSVLMFGTSLQHATLTKAHNVIGAKNSGRTYAAFTGSVLVMAFGGATAMALLCTIAGVVFSMVGLSNWALASFGIAVATIPWLLQDAVRRILYTRGRLAGAALNDLISFGLQVGGIGSLMVLGVQADVFLAFLVLGASSLIACLLAVFQLRAEVRVRLSRLRAHVSDVWGFGKWLTWGEMVGWLGQNGHAWLIGGFLGADLVGGYRAAMHVTNLLNPIDLACSNFLPSEAAVIYQKEGKGALTRWLGVRALFFGLPYLVLVVGMIVGARYLLDLFYSGRFTADVLVAVVALAAGSRLVGFFRSFVMIGLLAMGRTTPLFVEKLISLVFFATGSLFLISSLGLTGAPISRLLLGLILVAYLARAFYRPSREEQAAGSEMPRPSARKTDERESVSRSGKRAQPTLLGSPRSAT